MSAMDKKTDAPKHAAEEALLDQTPVKVDQEIYDQLLDVLDRPPSGAGFQRLMQVRKPWKP